MSQRASFRVVTFDRSAERTQVEPITPAAPIGVTAHEYLTVPEAAKIMRCSESKLYDLCRRRAIASIKFGRQRLLTRAEIADYMAKHKEAMHV